MRSEEIHQILGDFSQSKQMFNYWLSMKYIDSTGNLTWGTGENFIKEEFDNFHENNKQNFNCTRLDVTKKRWTRHRCKNKRQYICLKWTSKVQSVLIRFHTPNSNFSSFNGIYDPENGKILEGAPVYKKAMASENYFVYRGTNQGIAISINNNNICSRSCLYFWFKIGHLFMKNVFISLRYRSIISKI